MFRYIVRRILLLIPVVIGISLLVFSLIRFAPGDPVYVALGIDYTPELAAKLRAQWGLDRPLLEQYFWWLGNVLRGELGESIILGDSVKNLILSRLPTTLALAFSAMAFGLLVAIPLGIFAAIYQNSWIDNVSRIIAMLGVSMPVFWFGIILLIVFALNLGWFPPSGSLNQYGPIALVLPSIALGASFAALIMRIVRSMMVDVMQEDYVRTARAKGLRAHRIYLTHAFKNASIPLITIVGIQFGLILGGTVLTETIFNMPGLGRLLIEAVNRRDYPLIQGVILVTSLLFVLVNLLVDILYGVVDPRIRYD